MSTILIDGDSLVYRCGFAVEKTFYLVQGPDGATFSGFDNAKAAKVALPEGGELWTRKEVEPVENCLHSVKTVIRTISESLKSDDLSIILSGKTNFREELYPEYKANRINVPKPKYYRDIREYLTKTWKAVIATDGLEADDLLGITAISLRNENRPYVLVTQDKDLDQIPGSHYDWTTHKFSDITPEQGIRNFYIQLLAGDPTDNIVGCKGIGPAKAKAAIEGCKNPQQLAEAAYKVYERTLGHTPDGALDLNAHLVWIKRTANQSHPFWRHLGRERV